MQCPIDQTDLIMTTREGIEIDYCPKCRGIWLDRGELDKIIERSGAMAPEAAAPAERREPARREPDPYQDPYRDPRYDARDDPRYDSRGKPPKYKKRKKSKNVFGDFLEDVFDF